MHIITDALKSPSFIQAVGVLIITAVITGLTVPWIKANMDQRKLREQKIFEEGLARQSKVIDAQAALLEQLAELLWGFIILLLEVSYYRLHHNKKAFQSAWERYDKEGWSFFLKIRAQISKARRLTTTQAYQRLLSLYENRLMEMDSRLVALSGQEEDQGWVEFHKQMLTSTVQETDEVLNHLAEEIHLAESTRKQG